MGKRSDTARLETTAHHEAGHAVAAWVLGATLNNVSIVPDGKTLGRTSDNIVRYLEGSSIEPDEGSLDRVSVIPDGDHLVRCPVRLSPDADDATWDLDRGTWQDVERECIGCFAGVVAEHRFTGGRYNWAGAASDMDRVCQALYEACRVDEDAYRAYKRLHRRRAEHLVATWWPVVARLAAELLVHPQLTGMEATEVMLAAEQAMSSRRAARSYRSPDPSNAVAGAPRPASSECRRHRGALTTPRASDGEPRPTVHRTNLRRPSRPE